ncbi:26013_t:CDS:2 [Gigaspora rosea]|nr:26013_t:CDS:2 [Gigaspora rosea]
MKKRDQLYPSSRIDNWLHTYDICGAIGEAKQAATQNSIYYAQAYYIEKEAFSTPTSTLLAELTENTILKYSKKFGAILEYRIGLPIITTFYSQVELKIFPFLNTNPFYLIPTQLVSNIKIAKIKTFLNLYNFSFNYSLQLSPNNSILDTKSFRFCIFILIKTINQSLEAIPNITQYFGNSAEDNSDNVGTLEIYKIIEKSNTVWLFNLDNFTENTQNNQHD